MEWFGLSPEDDRKFKMKTKIYEASKKAVEIIHKHALNDRLINN